jgi:glycerol-3-phosphate dehydrogenase (NAD(P)+)
LHPFTPLVHEAEAIRILIAGYGEMGHAMEHLLGKIHQLIIYDCRPVEGLPSINVEREAALADFLLLCVPASPHHELLVKLAPHLQSHCICLSIAKGLDDKGRTPAQIYGQILNGQQPYCLLYGPMISEEIRSDRYAFAELGCSNASTYLRVRELYQDTRLYIKHSTDITGISWSVILKNVYAIAFGMADELQLGDNVRGFLTVTALAELCAIVKQMGGKPAAPLHLAGLGDLITTATSVGSHHHALGRKLVKGDTRDISGEGIHALEMVEKYQLFDASPYPLYGLIRYIVKEPVRIAQKFRNYLGLIQQ